MKKIKAYVCKTTWDTDLHLGKTCAIFYTTIRALKESCLCNEECGIIEVEIKLKKTVQPGKREF